VTPVTHAGRFIATLAAISGVLCISIPVSVISTNFTSEYETAQKAAAERKKQRHEMILSKYRSKIRKLAGADTGLLAQLKELSSRREINGTRDQYSDANSSEMSEHGSIGGGDSDVEPPPPSIPLRPPINVSRPSTPKPGSAPERQSNQTRPSFDGVEESGMQLVPPARPRKASQSSRSRSNTAFSPPGTHVSRVSDVGPLPTTRSRGNTINTRRTRTISRESEHAATHALHTPGTPSDPNDSRNGAKHTHAVARRKHSRAPEYVHPSAASTPQAAASTHDSPRVFHDWRPHQQKEIRDIFDLFCTSNSGKAGQ
jgi:hypothetical protein